LGTINPYDHNEKSFACDDQRGGSWRVLAARVLVYID
jgi:hypothetical protein